MNWTKAQVGLNYRHSFGILAQVSQLLRSYRQVNKSNIGLIGVSIIGSPTRIRRTTGILANAMRFSVCGLTLTLHIMSFTATAAVGYWQEIGPEHE